MATLVSSIGTATRTYSTTQAWEDDSPTDLTGDGDIWKGECYNDTEFTGALTIAGITADYPNNYPWLTCAAGESFIDDGTPVLDYDQGKGVGIAHSFTATKPFNFQADSLVERLQFETDETSSYSREHIAVAGIFKDCIIRSINNLQFSSGVLFMEDGGLAINPLIIIQHTDPAGTRTGRGIICRTATIYNAGVVLPTGYVQADLTGIENAQYKTSTILNSHVFGFVNGNAFLQSGNGWGASNYNATDDTTTPPGAQSLDTLTFADQFVDIASAAVDFSLKLGSGLIDTGNTDATNAPNDILGTVRGITTDGDIGPFEFVAAVGGATGKSNPLWGPLGGCLAGPIG